MATQRYSKRETRRMMRRKPRPVVPPPCPSAEHTWVDRAAKKAIFQVCTRCGVERNKYNKRRTPPWRERSSGKE